MKVCAKVCKECPFRKDSLRGWLGHHSIDEILDSIQWEIPFSCHMTRTDETTNEDIIEGRTPICRGFIASANKSCKMFGQNPQFPQLRELQKQVKSEAKEDASEILAKWEFREYHDLSKIHHQ